MYIYVYTLLHAYNSCIFIFRNEWEFEFESKQSRLFCTVEIVRYFDKIDSTSAHSILKADAMQVMCYHILNSPGNLSLMYDPGRENLYTEYGMPSSHTQFMWFFATYMVFFISVR